MTPLLAIARNAFIESLRQPIVLVIVLLCAVLQYLSNAMSAYSMSYRDVAGEVTGDDKLLFDIGMGTVFLCGILVASFVATAIISREIENKTVLTVVSKPIGRAWVVVGKFFGVMAATLLASVIMIVFLLFALRHGVLMNAGDKFHLPVITFGVGAIAISLAIAAFTNYAYGWPFSQTVLTVLLPLILVSYGLSLPFNKKFELQPIFTEVKPEVIKACLASLGALVVLTSIATAASTRCGQVLTIMICLGAFILGLLNDYFVGRHAFANTPIGIIETAEPVRPGMETLDQANDQWAISFGSPSDSTIAAGDRFFYGPAPNGLGMIPPAFDPPAEGVDLTREMFGPEVPPALVITEPGESRIVVKRIGSGSLGLVRPPEPGDYVFLEPTKVNWAARIVWTTLPRMHAFWLVDAVTQAARIPVEHVALVLVYSLVQAAGYLGLAVLLFQGRDLG